MIVDDDNFAAWSEFLSVAHGDSPMRPESALELLRMERHAATDEGREHVFIGTTGPFLRLPAETVNQPVMTMLAYSVAQACPNG